MQAVISLTFLLTCLCECEEECPHQDSCITEYCDDMDCYDEEDSDEEICLDDDDDSDDAVCLEEKEEKTPIRDFFFKDPNKEEESVKAKKTPFRDFFLKNFKNTKKTTDWEEPYSEQECCFCEDDEEED